MPETPGGLSRVVVFLPGQSAEMVRQLERYQLPFRFVACESEAEVADELPGAEILVSIAVRSKSLANGTSLKWIQALEEGIESWLGSEPRSIPITRMTGVYESYMAEYVFAHLLYTSQMLEELHDAQEQNRWAILSTRSLAGLTLGVAGTGYVGSAVGRLGKAFGMEVIGLRRTVGPPAPAHDFASAYFDRSQMNEFLRRLDVLVLALPATSDTNGMFGQAEFRALPKGATIVNVGRGNCVDETALLMALRDGHLGNAVIDTFRVEPLPPNSPLWKAPNITITPHMAGSVYANEVARMVARNIGTFLAGRIPEPVVDRNREY